MTRPVAVVTGMIATYNVGGVVWDYGQYLLGLEQLGFDVYYLEDTGGEAFDPDAGDYGSDYSYAAAFLADELPRLSPLLANRWHLRGMAGETYGMDRERLVDIVKSADVFLNVSGSALLRDEYLASPRKVLIDTDPGWNHFRNYPRWDERRDEWSGIGGWRAHDYFFTYAQSIGTASCALPLLGVPWHPTRPVVIPRCWERRPPGDTWTTVMSWKTYPEMLQHHGRVYGAKEIEFERIKELPKHVNVRLEVAVGGAPAPVRHWQKLGWTTLESLSVSRSACAYRNYLQTSRGEFSVAKNVYVATGSGWFSCRSVCYLAAGLPVVVQDTGFSHLLPVGEGIVPFRTLGEAIDGIKHVESGYEGHCEAAEYLALTEFGPERVLGDLLARARVG